MKWIYDEKVIAAYKQALACNLEKEFLQILDKELERRKIYRPKKDRNIKELFQYFQEEVTQS